MSSPLIEEMGFLAETDEAEQVLDGTYEVPPGVNKYTKEFINELRRPAIIKTLGFARTEISVEEHSTAWRKQKERTSAEPTGPSFSHYMAAAQDKELATIDALLRELPYKWGFSPKAWQTITDMAILKKTGVYDVELMRTIQLMQAEFNMNNKKLGKDTMKIAEAAKIVPWDQYGSRKNMRSIMAALNKRVTMDIFRQRRQAGAICSNDAKSCYDRIVHWVLSLALRRAGLPTEPATSMLDTLQKAEHFVSSAFGRSEKAYGKHRRIPVQGVGQGNGSGPAAWAVISAVIINMLYTARQGVQILSTITGVLLAFACYAFVDDTDIIHSGVSPEVAGEDVAKEMQDVVDRWEGGIRASGGALVPKKSHWYMIDFIWTGEKWRYKTIEEIPAELSVVDTDGKSRVKLTRHEVTHAEETLGVKLSMDGNNADEKRMLRKKAEEFADQMRTGSLDKNDVWFAITATIMKTLEYPMIATTLSKADWDHIMSPILTQGLPKANIERHFPRAVLYGPIELQGFGVMHPWHHQELLHLITLIDQLISNSLTGQLLTVSLEQMILEVGLPGCVFDYPYEPFQELITGSWIQTIWAYIDEFGIQIQYDGTRLETRRKEDKFIMLEFFRRGYSGTELRVLNECRTFLHAVTLADIW
jgi:hypothetical protein